MLDCGARATLYSLQQVCGRGRQGKQGEARRKAPVLVIPPTSPERCYAGSSLRLSARGLPACDMPTQSLFNRWVDPGRQGNETESSPEVAWREM